MLKFIKGLFLVLLLSIVVAIALGTIFAYYFDANDYKEQIVSYIEKQSKRSVELATLDLTLFPSLALNATELKVGENPSFGDGDFLAAKEIQLGLKLLPLLRQEAQVDGIVLKGIRINVLRNSRGQFNFDDLKALAATNQNSDSENKTADSAFGALALTSFGGVVLDNGYLLWDDQLNATRIAVDDLNFELGALSFSEPIPVSLNAKAQLLSGDFKDMTATTMLNAEVLPNSSWDTMHVNDVTASARLQGLDKDLNLQLIAENNKALLEGDFDIDRFAISYGDTQVAGRVKLTDLYQNPKADIAIPTFNYDAWQFKQILLTSSKVGDRVLLNLQRADFHQGQISANADVDLASDSYRMKLSADEVPIDKIQIALSAEQQATVRGQARVGLVLRGAIGDLNRILESSDGEMKVHIKQGALQDKSLAAIVERVAAFLEGRARRSAGEELIFDDMRASATLNKGIAKNNDLAVRMPLLDVKGAGQVDLIRSRIDYMLHARLKSIEQIQIPIRIYGDLQSPDYRPDFGQLIKHNLLNSDKLKEKLEEKVTDIEQKIEDKIKGGLLEDLKDKLKLPF